MRRFSSLLRQHLDQFARAWVDDVYAERRTDLSTILSAREMVEHLPELFDELGYLLDERASADEIAQAAPRLRGLAQTRFQQGVLIDEVARELMLLRDALCEFLWEEGPFVVEGDVRELRAALRRTRLFCDELIAQAILVYAASLRPVVPTRGSVWPPPRRRKK
jgi:RsbT co-antagonist protein rsbRD N-terminal domain